VNKINRAAQIDLFVLLLAIALAWLSTSGTVHALDPGLARGVLTIRGASIALRHAYVWHHDGTKRSAAGWSVLLTDREVPMDLLAEPGAEQPQHWARDNRLKGVLLLQQTKPQGQQWIVRPLLAQETEEARLNHLAYRLGPQGLRILGDVEMDTVSANPLQQGFALKAHFSAPVFHGTSVRRID
jgi:hypothetical protein